MPQYSEKNTCVRVTFNKENLLKTSTQVFYCKYCEIFKKTYFASARS